MRRGARRGERKRRRAEARKWQCHAFARARASAHAGAARRGAALALGDVVDALLHAAHEALGHCDLGLERRRLVLAQLVAPLLGLELEAVLREPGLAVGLLRRLAHAQQALEAAQAVHLRDEAVEQEDLNLIGREDGEVEGGGEGGARLLELAGEQRRVALERGQRGRHGLRARRAARAPVVERVAHGAQRVRRHLRRLPVLGHGAERGHDARLEVVRGGVELRDGLVRVGGQRQLAQHAEPAAQARVGGGVRADAARGRLLLLLELGHALLRQKHAQRRVAAQVRVGQHEQHELLKALHALLDEALALVAHDALLRHERHGDAVEARHEQVAQPVEVACG